MINWFKKPKITFECLVPGVERIMPIIPARELKHAWMIKAQRDLAEKRNHADWGMERLIHVARCPGIFSLQRYGWVLRTWQDITIDTNGDGYSFVWETPIDQKELVPSVGDYVGSQPSFMYADYTEEWFPNTLKSVVKITSGWACTVPEGYYLLEMPIPYLEENRFTLLPGFFEKRQGYATMNPQLLWHIPHGKTLIKAGTPIAQYILVRKEAFDMEIKTIGSITDMKFFHLTNANRFVKNYGDTHRIYGETK